MLNGLQNRIMNKLFKLIVLTSSIIYAVLFSSASSAQSVLQEIQQTGVLKVGIRKDAVLFGYEISGNWTGYCVGFANALASSLSKQMNTRISVRAVTSTISTREGIVRDGTVHIECGPNTISREKEVQENIKYSDPFFVTGTQFIVRTANKNANLKNTRLGVLRGSTNIRSVTQTYSEAEIQQFSDRSEGVSAAMNGQVTAFAGDSILLIGEAVRQGVPFNAFEIVPNQPLSCDFYGMILPVKDTRWHNTVNSFIGSSQGLQVWGNWFGSFGAYLRGTLDYCKSR